jgi:NADH-quinone oxidoreductase subunit M
MFAYSSMAHVGMIAAALFTLNSIAIQGALFQMFSHGITIIALFFIADIFKIRTDFQLTVELGGYKTKAPVFAAFYLVVLFASIGLPLTSGFVGEFLMISGLTGFRIWFGAAAGLSIILGAVYMLNAYKSTMLGELKSKTSEFMDLNSREIIVLVFILVIVFIAGVFPTLFLSLTEKSVEGLLSVF